MKGLKPFLKISFALLYNIVIFCLIIILIYFVDKPSINNLLKIDTDELIPSCFIYILSIFPWTVFATFIHESSHYMVFNLSKSEPSLIFTKQRLQPSILVSPRYPPRDPVFSIALLVGPLANIALAVLAIFSSISSNSLFSYAIMGLLLPNIMIVWQSLARSFNNDHLEIVRRLLPDKLLPIKKKIDALLFPMLTVILFGLLATVFGLLYLAIGIITVTSVLKIQKSLLKKIFVKFTSVIEL